MSTEQWDLLAGLAILAGILSLIVVIWTNNDIAWHAMWTSLVVLAFGLLGSWGSKQP